MRKSAETCRNLQKCAILRMFAECKLLNVTKKTRLEPKPRWMHKNMRKIGPKSRQEKSRTLLGVEKDTGNSLVTTRTSSLVELPKNIKKKIIMIKLFFFRCKSGAQEARSFVTRLFTAAPSAPQAPENRLRRLQSGGAEGAGAS